MRRDELSHLMLFMAVAEERSFTRAAVRLDVSQSAVSHAVRRLEDSIGMKLLNRTSRKVSTTEAGVGEAIKSVFSHYLTMAYKYIKAIKK